MKLDDLFLVNTDFVNSFTLNFCFIRPTSYFCYDYTCLHFVTTLSLVLVVGLGLYQSE